MRDAILGAMPSLLESAMLAQEAPKPGQSKIANVSESCAMAVGKLNMVVGDLEERLRLVLRSGLEEAPSPDADVLAAFASPLTTQMTELLGGIKGVTERLSVIIERLEV